MDYINKKFDEERALYNIENSKIISCDFEGEADGESALKETKGLYIKDCRFLLRYPMWHMSDSVVENSYMSETCRAALWYDKNLSFNECNFSGIKALRECDSIKIKNSSVNSTEFGWFCSNVSMEKCSIITEYPFLKSKHLKLEETQLKGKYSFQYTEDVTIDNCVLDTKDAFWHAKNVIVTDCTVKGEYLAWYSDSVKFVRCKIIGTQPFCYCKNLVLEDCEMIETDLSFEKSDVVAKINGKIDSVKDPISGYIKAESIGEIIWDEADLKISTCKIETTEDLK